MKHIRPLVAALCALLLPIFVSAEAPVVGPNTFSFTTAGQSNVWTCNGGQSSFALTVPAGLTGVLTVTVAQSMNGTYSEPPWAYVPGTPVYTNTLTNSGSLTVNLGSNGYVKVADTTYTSGSATVTGVCSSAVAVIPPQVTSLAAGSNIVITTPSPAQPMVSVTAAPSFTSLSLTTPLAIASGGTGSATQNFVDLTSAQTIAGIKTFSSAPVSVNGYATGSSAYGPISASVNGALTATQFNGSGAGLTAATVPNAALVTTPVTSVTATGNLASSGGTTPAITMSATPTFTNLTVGSSSWTTSSSATVFRPESATQPFNFVNAAASATNFSITDTGNATLAGALTLGTPLAIASGGNGTSTPLLAATSPITVSGSWPAQNFACATCVTSVSGTGNVTSTGGTTPTINFAASPTFTGVTVGTSSWATSGTQTTFIPASATAPLTWMNAANTTANMQLSDAGNLSLTGSLDMTGSLLTYFSSQFRFTPASAAQSFNFVNFGATATNLQINNNGTVSTGGALTVGGLAAGVTGANSSGTLVAETLGNGLTQTANTLSVNNCSGAICKTGLDMPLCYQNGIVSTSAPCPTQDVSTTIGGGVLTQLVAYCTGEDNGTTVFTLYTVNTGTNAQTSVATMTLGNAVYRTTAAISVALAPPEALYGNVTTAGTASNCSFSVDGTQNVQ